MQLIIGGEEHDVKVTYRMRRKWLESFNPKVIEKMAPAEFDDVVMDILLMDHQIKEQYVDRDGLMDVLTNDEFKDISQAISQIPVNEGMADIEKKQEATTGLLSTRSGRTADSVKKSS